jgi:hypothetical protein
MAFDDPGREVSVPEPYRRQLGRESLALPESEEAMIWAAGEWTRVYR